MLLAAWGNWHKAEQFWNNFYNINFSNAWRASLQSLWSWFLVAPTRWSSWCPCIWERTHFSFTKIEKQMPVYLFHLLSQSWSSYSLDGKYKSPWDFLTCSAVIHLSPKFSYPPSRRCPSCKPRHLSPTTSSIISSPKSIQEAHRHLQVAPGAGPIYTHLIL